MHLPPENRFGVQSTGAEQPTHWVESLTFRHGKMPLGGVEAVGWGSA